MPTSGELPYVYGLGDQPPGITFKAGHPRPEQKIQDLEIAVTGQPRSMPPFPIVVVAIDRLLKRARAELRAAHQDHRCIIWLLLGTSVADAAQTPRSAM